MDKPLRNRHERRRLQTRHQLIQAALQLILEKGYDAISIQNITDLADLGRGTFYIHFKSKEDVLWTAFREKIQELEQVAHKELDRRTPQVEYYGLLNIFRHAENNRVLYRVMLGRLGSAILTTHAQDLLAEVFLHDIREAAAPPDIDFKVPEEIEAQLLTGMITRLLFWWLETPNNYSAEQMASITYKALYRKKPPTE